MVVMTVPSIIDGCNWRLDVNGPFNVIGRGRSWIKYRRQWKLLIWASSPGGRFEWWEAPNAS